MRDFADIEPDVAAPSAVGRQLRRYFGSTGDGSGPQAHHVALQPHNTIRPHFHAVDQFQLLFGAPGFRYQRRPVEGLLLHYVDAYVGYGPIATDDAPASFFTLRATHSPFVAFLPEERDKLVRRGRRHLALDLDLMAERAPGAGVVQIDAVIEPHDDGLAAAVVHLGPGASLPCPSAVAGRGQYHCVLSGDVVVGDRRFGVLALGWQPPGSDAIELTAGAHGAHVLFLQFPTPTTSVDAQPDHN